MNVLLIICDDLNDWVLHPADHPQARVPNIDRLREGSVNFANAHAAVPVCSPARKCLFSGLQPWTTGEYGFRNWVNCPGLEECTPLPLHFRDNGYGVFGTGKLLHEGKGGDFYTDYGIDVDYGPWPSRGKGPVRHTPHPDQYETWKEHLPVEMHRDLNYAPLDRVPEWNPNQMPDTPGARGWFYENGERFRYENDEDRDRMPDELSADWAIDVLGRRHDRPFYLGVGFVRPHTPLYVPRKYYEMFPLDEVTLPPYLEGDLEDCAPALRDRWQWGFKKFEALLAAGGERAWREWVQAYLAATAFVDEQIGRVLDALEASPYSEDTIVLLTGDNGYHVGEKDCIQKWHLWDESTRIPLLMRAPGAAGNGKRCGVPVSHIDVYPTLVDLCDLPLRPHENAGMEGLEGHSLRSLLERPDGSTWADPAGVLSAVKDDDRDIPHVSLRTQRYRYTLCSTGEEELYDHRKDPHEWTNLAQSPVHGHVRARLRRQLEQRLPPSFGRD